MTNRMDMQALLTPTGMGKTGHLIDHLLQSLKQTPLMRVWVLLATKRQESAFRQRLAEVTTAENSVFFNVEFFNFYELYARLLEMAGNPQRLLDETTRIQLLRDVIVELPDLTVFASIAHTPGFINIVADFIYELKQSRVDPAIFTAAARDSKDHDLARIYSAYQARLQAHHLADREGQGWLAVDAFADVPDLADSVDLLLVDGFDQFTPVQADLIARLAAHVGQVKLTMTQVTGREQTIGRRFTQALENVRYALGTDYQTETLGQYPIDNRHPDLAHLTATIFQPNAEQKTSTGGVRFIEAPHPAAEVGAVLRQVKSLLLQGVPADSILIALRDWGIYQPYFNAYAKQYDLPLALHYGEPITASPPIVALIDMINLASNGFRHRDVLDVLGSAYWHLPDLTPDAIAIIEAVSYHFNVVRGRDQWLDALRADYLPDADKAQLSDDDPSPSIDPVARAAACDALEALFHAVTPPTQATVADFIRWLEGIIGEDEFSNPDEASDTADSIHHPVIVTMMPRIRAEGTPEDIIARDLAALQTLKRGLKALLTADDLMQSLDGRTRQITWDAFYADLQRTMSALSITPRPARFGRVLVTSATDARGLPHDYVFIVGLSEGIFPAPIKADPLYLDSERLAMRFNERLRLDTQAERRADDGLFYELISIPQKALILSRPAYQEGKAWLPSSLWRQAMQVFSHADDRIAEDRIPLAAPVPLSQAVTHEEVAIAIMHDLMNNPTTTTGAESALSWLKATSPALVANVRTGQRVEASRYTATTKAGYDGGIRDADLLAALQTIVGTDARWSASRFNSFGHCGFQFFARYVLKLEAIKPPEEGMDVLQRGTLYHDILEQTYAEIKIQKLTIQPTNTPIALTIFESIAHNVLAQAPHKMNFRAGSLWRYEQEAIRKRLEQFIRADFAGELYKRFKIPLENRRPYQLEKRFNTTISAEDGTPIHLTGYIDRIDQTDDGLLVVDYKSGSGSISREEMREGRNVQIALYLLALDALEQDTAIGGAFWQIGNATSSGDVIRTDAEHQQALADTHEKILSFVAAARRGEFNIAPSKPTNGYCRKNCEFARLCRYSVSRRGGEE